VGNSEECRDRPRAATSRTTWPQFLRSQAEAILACDFFTADLLDGTQAYVLAVIEHATRRIRILGVTSLPTGEWTAQQARNLIMDLGEQAARVKVMIRDRGSNYTAAFDAVLADAGIRTVLCNVRTPRMNAIAERWIGGCRRELPGRTFIWNENHLRRILREYETHHNQHRPHRSLDSAAPLKPLPEPVDLEQHRVRRHPRVGGMINEYRLVTCRGRGSRHPQAVAGLNEEEVVVAHPEIVSWGCKLFHRCSPVKRCRLPPRRPGGISVVLGGKSNGYVLGPRDRVPRPTPCLTGHHCLPGIGEPAR
jgi:hypothetical protein